MILSAHYELPVDTTVRFITANNVVVEGIIRGKARHPAYDDRIHYPDLTIYTLETPLPPSITPCKMLPANYAAYLSYLENGRPPVMILNKEEKALVHELRFIGAFNDRLYALVPGPFTHFVRPGLHGKRLEFFRGLVPGDSGNPEFLIINDTLVLLSTTTFSDGRGSFVTPQISTLNAMIAAADAHAASRGYPLPTEQQGQTVQTIDLSAFTTFTPSP